MTDSPDSPAGADLSGTGANAAATALRAIATWLEAHPEYRLDGIAWPLYSTGTVEIHHFGTHSAEDIATLARTIGGRWDKEVNDGIYDQFKLRQEIAPGVVAEIVTSRENVCKRVVTGTTEVTVSEPDPAAVAALPTVERTQVIETYEWECGPLLKDAA